MPPSNFPWLLWTSRDVFLQWDRQIQGEIPVWSNSRTNPHEFFCSGLRGNKVQAGQTRSLFTEHYPNLILAQHKLTKPYNTSNHPSIDYMYLMSTAYAFFYSGTLLFLLFIGSFLLFSFSCGEGRGRQPSCHYKSVCPTEPKASVSVCEEGGWVGLERKSILFSLCYFRRPKGFIR